MLRLYRGYFGFFKTFDFLQTLRLSEAGLDSSKPLIFLQMLRLYRGYFGFFKTFDNESFSGKRLTDNG
ncbi:hypothetical protein FHS57_003875 [Runella defluvii]|uniref:Uncharacterized protein n=1 Tax=Runella defluvii TaxID=370973 RepID=A0A7W6ERM1_9BACT|nr:hypothetical protein [Runella defluvii]